MTKLIGKISYSSSSHTLEGSRLITIYYVNVTRLAQQGFRKLFSTKSGCGGRSDERAFFCFFLKGKIHATAWKNCLNSKSCYTQ